MWNFVVDAGKLSGTAVESSGDGDLLTGTVTNGTDVALTTKNDTTASGKIEGTKASGTWQSAGGSKGTWTGTAGCGG